MRDRQLVQRILDGDEAAGERLVAEQYPRLYRLLCHLTGSRETAQDLVQQAFLNAWRSLSSFRGEASLRTWLHRIAYHEYTHWLRGRREQVPLDEAASVVDACAERQWEALLLREALAQLSPEHRETFLLYHAQGLSVSEAAVVLDVPAGTVKSRLFTARQRLRELLSPTEEAAPRSKPVEADTPQNAPECEGTACRAHGSEGGQPS